MRQGVIFPNIRELGTADANNILPSRSPPVESIYLFFFFCCAIVAATALRFEKAFYKWNI